MYKKALQLQCHNPLKNHKKTYNNNKPPGLLAPHNVSSSPLCHCTFPHDPIAEHRCSTHCHYFNLFHWFILILIIFNSIFEIPKLNHF